MKRRNRSRRGQVNQKVGGWLKSLTKRASRVRRSWTFERLEDRYYFTASPMTGLEGLSWYTVSNSTSEGQELIDALSELWALQASSNGSAETNLAVRAAPTDPGFQFQWHLFNVGQNVTPGQINNIRGVPGEDINVLPVWDSGITGAGVNVAVVDTGVELNHPDLFENINAGLAFSAIPGNVDVSAQGSAAAAHGTAVAGLIAAVDNNGRGGVGVAHGATLIPIRLIPTSLNPIPEIPGASEAAFIRAVNGNGAPIDIFNHSWGPEDVIIVDGEQIGNRGVDALTMNELIALTNSARSGRNGLGAIHVFAAGNGAEAWDSAGSDGYVNSRYTIAVGIVDHDGKYLNSDNTSTGYGEMAPSVLIVAPSGSGPTDIINDFDTGSGIFTTDLTLGGINVPPLNGVEFDLDPHPDDDYTSRFGGTSAAAPLVSGVIALMLEANPNLTYRDVEEILVRSARQNDDLDPSWVVNNIAIFRDPIAPDPSQDPINDGIEFIIVPGTITTPAVPAATPPITSANMATFSIHAVAGGSFDGVAGNAISVDFNSVAGPNGVLAQLQGNVIVVTVSGTPTWGAIAGAIGGINGGGDFELRFANAAHANLQFNPADGSLMGQLAGGADAVGEGPTAGNADPSYHPIFNPRTQPLPVGHMTNGAGFTVSHGRRPGDATEYGYAHGVVDAALAVNLARQWHLKDQNLPAEKTWLANSVGTVIIRAAEVSNEESGEFLIPGGLVSNTNEGFIEFFNEFFKEPTVEEGDPMGMPPTMDMIDPESLPFAGDDPPVNNRGSFIAIDVPAIDPVTGGSNLMSVEWVELQLNVSGDADALNYLRITLVSPDGTHSELTQNHFRGEHIDKSYQDGTLPVNLFVGFGDSLAPEDENGTNGDTLDWVYSTNRHWGERSDSNFSGTGSRTGVWEVHFENWSGSDLDLNGFTVAFHGTPIGSPGSPVERVTGKVGVDGGRFLTLSNQIVGAQDEAFNFSRMVPNSTFEDDFLFPGGFKPDPLQEDFAGNVTVYAIDNATGQRVAEFLTGADGNYYFDLPAGQYTIGIEDPLGRTALDSGINFDDEWIVTVDTADLDPRSAASEVNFLLDPGSLPPSEVIFTGQVVGDLDADGALDPADIGVFNFTVYADLNYTGQFEIGEPFALTAQDGTYTLNVPTATPNTFTVGVKAPTGWVATNPVSGFQSDYALPGETVPNINFMFTPPTDPSGEGPGTLFGLIFSDKNGDGDQDPNEVGLAGRTVFIDTDQDGILDDGETSVVTNANGAYQFGEVPLGSFRLDVVINEPFKLTSPIKNAITGEGWIDVTLVAGEVVRDLDFGVQNQAVNDYGDLVGFGFATGSASALVVQGVHLGSGVDTEIRPKNLTQNEGGGYSEDPNLNGIGDDQNQNESSFDDEDGVVLVGGVLRPGSNLLEITVGGVGFYLQGWIDFDDSGTFESNERIFNNLDINPGTHELVINAPANLVDGEVAARFRWGTINQTFSSADTFGEIEDYLFETAVPALGDYNADGNIDQDDYRVWKTTFGSTNDLRADGNKNGIIDSGDYTVWRTIKDSGGGGSAAVAMAPPLPQVTPAALTLSEPVEPPAPQTVLQLLGEQPALLGIASQQPESSGAGSVVISASVVESGPTIATSRLAAGVPLVSVFTASVASTEVESVAPQAGFSGESADLAMLLLATGYFQGQQLSSADDADDADTAWLNEGERDGDMDLAIAAVFEDERDWRFAL